MIKNGSQAFRPRELVASMSSLMQGVGLRDAIEAWQQGRLTEATDANACKAHRDVMINSTKNTKTRWPCPIGQQCPRVLDQISHYKI